MNIRVLIAGVCLFTLGGLYSCQPGSDKQPEPKEAAPAAHETWECPMKCDGKKFDKAGQCPVCEMDLVKVSEG